MGTPHGRGKGRFHVTLPKTPLKDELVRACAGLGDGSGCVLRHELGGSLSIGHINSADALYIPCRDPKQQIVAAAPPGHNAALSINDPPQQHRISTPPAHPDRCHRRGGGLPKRHKSCRRPSSTSRP